MLHELNVLSLRLARSFGEGTARHCVLRFDEERQKVRWSLVLDNDDVPIEPLTEEVLGSKQAQLTNYTFTVTLYRLFTGIARAGLQVWVNRYGKHGFTLTVGEGGPTFSISYGPPQGAVPGLSFFALTMDSSYHKPLEVVLPRVTLPDVDAAIESAVVELRSYMTTTRLRNLSSSKR